MKKNSTIVGHFIVNNGLLRNTVSILSPAPKNTLTVNRFEDDRDNTFQLYLHLSLFFLYLFPKLPAMPGTFQRDYDELPCMV